MWVRKKKKERKRKKKVKVNWLWGESGKEKPVNRIDMYVCLNEYFFSFLLLLKQRKVKRHKDLTESENQKETALLEQSDSFVCN